MPFEARLSKIQLLRLLAIGIAFVLIGVWLTGAFGPVGPIRGWSPGSLHVFGWVAIVFFGAGAAVIAARLAQAGPEMRIDAEGVYARRHSKQVVPWSAIERITTADGGRMFIARLRLHEPDDCPPGGIAGWVSRLAGRSGSKPSGDVRIVLQATHRTFEEMTAAFAYFTPAKLLKPAVDES